MALAFVHGMFYQVRCMIATARAVTAPDPAAIANGRRRGRNKGRSGFEWLTAAHSFRCEPSDRGSRFQPWAQRGWRPSTPPARAITPAHLSRTLRIQGRAAAARCVLSECTRRARHSREGLMFGQNGFHDGRVSKRERAKGDTHSRWNTDFPDRNLIMLRR